MCGETRIPRDMCAGNTLPGETYITVTAVWLAEFDASEVAMTRLRFERFTRHLRLLQSIDGSTARQYLM